MITHDVSHKIYSKTLINLTKVYSLG